MDRVEQTINKNKKMKIKSGDEVCAFDDFSLNLVRGIANQPLFKNNSHLQETEWSVSWKWSHYKSNSVLESDIIPTGRGIYKGCKVRSVVANNDEIKEGTCRSVIYHADLRVVGTTTIIPWVNMEEFLHLKDYKQQSVVHYNGWLGVISKVERLAEVIYPNEKQARWVSLNRIIPISPLGRESPFIYEVHDWRPTSADESADESTNEPTDESTVETTPELSVLIKNLKVSSVTVDWHHQIDFNFPDKPRQKFAKNSHLKLQLVKEDTSTEFLDLACLGRYKINHDTEFCSWGDWHQAFVRKYYPGIADKLKDRYSSTKSKAANFCCTYDENNFSTRLQTGQLKAGDTVVVELFHLNSTPDVQWQDGTSSITSSFEVEPIDDCLMKSLVPGDFIYSRQLEYKSDDVFFVLLSEKSTIDGRKFVVHVLDAHVPGKVLKSNVTIDANPKSKSQRIQRHPVYQYFNEMNTIVVVTEDVENVNSNKVRIGYVLRTNLIGKVNVRCVDTGRDEWFWPQNCAIYSIKGFDLECIKSHITDCGNEAHPETKLRNIMDMLKERVEFVWRNDSKLESDLQESLSNFERLHCSYLDVVRRLNTDVSYVKIDSTAYEELKLCLETQYANTNNFYKIEAVANLVLNAVKDLIRQAENILAQLMQNSTLEVPNDVNMSYNADVSSSLTIDTELQNMFSKTAEMLDTHPPNHTYAVLTSYEPQSHKLLLKIVKEEMLRLQGMCSTEMQTQMGILVRTYSDRMDLSSILIRGPHGTPYEDSLYLFDVHLPSDYPNVPPKFHFHSFLAGRLNPNLYSEGRVCVSLLGTWMGSQRENWTKNSNIAQILLSIQALILVKDPYHNEPGQEANKYTVADANVHNRVYNQDLMPKIIEMMINQINFGIDPWQEIVRTFYKHQIPIFITRWRKWLAVESKESLSQEDQPGFEVYPMTDNFSLKMSTSITRLEKLWSTNLNV